MGQLQIAALIAAVSLLGGFTAGWKVNGWRYEADRQVASKVFTEAMEMAAKELAKIEVKNVTIRQQLETKIIERSYYRECKHDDDGMRLLNEALTGKPISDSKLPTTNPVK